MTGEIRAKAHKSVNPQAHSASDPIELNPSLEQFLLRIVKEYSYYSKQKSLYGERKFKRSLSIRRAAATLLNPPRLAGWWRKIIPPKRSLGIPAAPAPGKAVENAAKLLGWSSSNWTLGEWYRRVPQPCLWGYAIEATERFSSYPNPVFLAKALASAAQLWAKFPDPLRWKAATFYMRRRRGLSYQALVELLQKALEWWLERAELLSTQVSPSIGLQPQQGGAVHSFPAQTRWRG